MSNYKDRLLSDYIPTVLERVKQYQALTYSEQPEIYALFSEIQAALDNQFIQTSTKYGVERWEKLLEITPKATSTLDERKFAVFSRLSEELPFTYRMLEQMLSALCGENGFQLKLNNADYELYIKIKDSIRNNYNNVRDMLKRVIPANIVILLGFFDTFSCKTYLALALQTSSRVVFTLELDGQKKGEK